MSHRCVRPASSVMDQTVMVNVVADWDITALEPASEPAPEPEPEEPEPEEPNLARKLLFDDL